MRAKNRYRLIVRPAGVDASALEIVDIDAGEAVLFWDLLRRDAKTVSRMVRADLEALDDREFFERWASFAGDEDLR
jgi:hypothetical protein